LKICWEIILEDGVKALAALKRGVSSEAVENVIEANTLMSGLGFENAGCAAAHGIHAGLTELPETHSFLHGEKVAFGIVCQMVLENAASEEMDKVIGFLVEVGLPVTLAQLGVEPKAEKIKVVADKVALHNPLIIAEPFFIDETIVFNAIVLAEASLPTRIM
jgi:glycerol dehydrogenase